MAAFLSNAMLGSVFVFFKSVAPVPKNIPGDREERLVFCPKIFLRES